MLPFCGYNMADYLGHWLKMGRQGDPEKLPRIFYVNWFRKDEEGKFLWPGYGENSRVLEWVFERCDGGGDAIDSPIGILPGTGAIPAQGLEVSDGDMEELLRVDIEGWRQELPSIQEHFDTLGERVPAELLDELAELEKRLD
jgi:phosphoenolpyruvate carboxykinase (GTP)